MLQDVEADNYQRYKQIQYLKKYNIARNIININVLHYECNHCQTKFSTHPIYFSFLKFSYCL